MKRFLSISILAISIKFSLFSQSISGIINIYTPVTSINNTSCTPSITVLSSAGFSVGDTVLIIQMKGAAIDSSNTVAFGTINSYGNCGNYEYNIIAGVAGNVITLKNSLLRTYTITQFVQLISVPVYNNATITGMLTAQNWSVASGTGGVLTFIDRGTTTFNANIDVGNKGFQGTPSQTTGWVGCSINFIEPASGIEALKGESIAILSANYIKGTGAPANGGGGGITDNGGGGASNFGAGGLGGQMGWMASCNTRAQLGHSLTYSNPINKIFLGGAGGDAQKSEGPGTNMGVSGAGIVILRTTGITGNNFSILAQGSSAINTVQDGGGGGGAGGTVLLECPSYAGNININTSGGAGGSANTYSLVACSAGGGGGGGIVWVSTPVVPANIIYTSNGGAGGISQSTVNGDPGSPGGSLTNLVIPQSTVAGSMTVTATPINLQCNGQTTGSATANTAGGTAPFTYVWNNGQSTSTATGLSAGNYTVTVNDNSGCSNTMTVQVTQPLVLTLTVSGTGASCNQSNGSATANVSGGTSGYTYSWSPSSQTTQNSSGLAGGNYTLTVTDANGCTNTQTVSISNSNALNTTLSQTTILCNGGTATATVTPTGGTPAFTYMWSNAQTTSVATGLTPGNYSVVITDATGCTSTQTVSISQPTAITSSVAVTNTTCGNNVGSAAVTASGGTGTLTYSWSPSGQTTPTATGLGSGIYNCTITDANGCTQTATANIVSSNGPSATASVNNNVSCNGGNNGAAAIVASGGSAPYTYSWSNGQSTSAGTNLSAGNYTVTVTDVTGCTSQQTVTITQPSAIIAVTLSSGDTCSNNTGQAGVIASNGSAPYSYSWNNGQTTQISTGLASGIYSVTITDANGCTKVAITTVSPVNGAQVNAGTNVSIMQGSNTQLNATGSSTYTWVPASNLSCTNCANPIASPSSTTTYTVFAVDASGCASVDSVTVYIEIPCDEAMTDIMPNAFSPNGDGENDVFRCYLDPRCVKEFTLNVFNRWGEKVFEALQVTDGWNGYYKDRLSNTAVYAFYCHVIFIDGKETDQKGNVSLIR